MGYSLNFYLDNAISDKQQAEIKRSKDTEAKRAMDKTMSEKPLQIFVYLRYSGKTVKVYTERKCTQKQWDFSKQRVNPNYYKAGAPEINEYLSTVHNQVIKLHESNNNGSVITTKEHIKSVIAKLNNKPDVNSKEVTLEKAFGQYVEVSKIKKSTNTVKKYTGAWNHLQSFARHKKVKLDFNYMDLAFEYEFRSYLINQKGLIDNTCAKYIKTIKAFMKFAHERNYHSNTAYLKFHAVEKEGEVYILSIPELMNLYNFEFNNDSLSKVRDVFCFMCFTGLRYSDVAKLRREDIKGDVLNITIVKTKRNTIIPLNPFAKRLLAKYADDKKPLPVISNQKMNDYLKEVGLKVGLTEMVKIKKYINTELQETYVPKYEVLTCHVGRKTFTTNSLILGMSETETKDITGHRDNSSFRRYVQIADAHKQTVMNRVWSEESINKNIN